MEPAIVYNFPLDDFQVKAIEAIHRGENVLVTAKTGSGKTLVGEYQIAYSLREGKRVFYTTPIKSLTNQKYHDLKHLFPKASVGIMTGDIKSCPEADIVVMTTEILRNLLFKQSTSTALLGTAGQLGLERLGAVVFDEVHYINDLDRGHVWEETLILLDPGVRLVLLSATIDAPEAFAGWLTDIKHVPMNLIQTTRRVVPLVHGVYDPNGKELPLQALKQGDEAPFRAHTYTDWLKGRAARAKAADEWAQKVRAGVADNKEKVSIHAFNHSMNECVTQLQTRGLLPALFFVFSRKECERYADLVHGSLIDSSDAAAVQHMIHFHLHHYPALLVLPQYHQIVRLLTRGIAFHHSGLLPLLKEIVELLFSRGYVKALFCTETFAVGLNMPARTVVFLDLKKPSEDGVRPLLPHEYIQMAGRAGRRGKDSQGLVLYLPARKPLELEELRSIFTGPLQPLVSRLQFHYDFILKALHSGKDTWSAVINASYWNAQKKLADAATQAELRVLQDERVKVSALLRDSDREAFLVQRELEAKVKTSVNAPKRKAQIELEQWKDRHRGPTWTAAKQAFDTEERLSQRIAKMESSVCEGHDTRIQPILSALEDWGAVQEEGTLTEFGVCATEINEGNPLLIAKLYASGLLKDASPQEIVAVLGCFIVDREAEEKTVAPEALPLSTLVKQTLRTIDQWGCEGVAIDKRHGVLSPDGFWSLTTLWTSIGAQWMDGAEAAGLAAHYEVYEGNLMRGLLKLNNIVNEWITVATYKADVDMLEKLKDVPATLMRDIVCPESLYLRV